MPQPRRTDENSDVLINLRVTEEERARLKQAAAANFQTLSEFARDVLTDAVSETLDDDRDDGTPY